MRPAAFMSACLSVGAIAASVTGTAAAASPRSVVVDWRGSSHTATLARPSGALTAVHTASPARVGSVVRMAGARRLSNGTLAAGLRTVGRARHARVRGTVVAVIPGRAIALSGVGTTFMVKLNRGKKHSHEVAASPAVGSTVTADVNVMPNGELDATNLNATNAPAAGRLIELEGQISAVNATASSLGINGLAVSSASGALAALGLLDSAVGQVSALRASFGTAQNRLESAITPSRSPSRTPRLRILGSATWISPRRPPS